MAGALAQDTRVPRAADDRRRRRRGRSFLAAGVHRGAAHTKEHWQQFGRFLARLHSTTQDHFGLDSNNYIRSLPQVNTPERDWPTFFLRHRLEPLVKAARDAHAMDGGTTLRSEQTYIRLGDLFPPGPPTLLHGDLRSGNFLCNADDRPVLFDPPCTSASGKGTSP